jgi:hypothetical protein
VRSLPSRPDALSRRASNSAQFSTRERDVRCMWSACVAVHACVGVSADAWSGACMSWSEESRSAAYSRRQLRTCIRAETGVRSGSIALGELYTRCTVFSMMPVCPAGRRECQGAPRRWPGTGRHART